MSRLYRPAKIEIRIYSCKMIQLQNYEHEWYNFKFTKLTYSRSIDERVSTFQIIKVRCHFKDFLKILWIKSHAS